MAQVWQTPGAGEEAVAGMISSPLADRVAMFIAAGMTEEIAARVVSGFNADMARCILALYRDAAQPALRELGKDLALMRERPGLVIIAENDHYVGTDAMHRQVAARANAQVSVLKQVGHWWMVQAPKAGAAMLNAFWKSID